MSIQAPEQVRQLLHTLLMVLDRFGRGAYMGAAPPSPHVAGECSKSLIALAEDALGTARTQLLRELNDW